MMTIPPRKRKNAKLPPVLRSHRSAIQEFLQHFLAKVVCTHKEHAELARTDHDPRLAGQIRFFKNQVQTIQWLIAMNDQRRGNE